MAYSAEVNDFANRIQGYHLALSKNRENFNDCIKNNEKADKIKLINSNMYYAYNKLADDLISYITSAKLTEEEAKYLIEIVGRDLTTKTNSSDYFINMITDLKKLQELEDKRAVYDELYYGLVNNNVNENNIAEFNGNQRVLYDTNNNNQAA